MTRPLIVGFVKMRNEIVREGDAYRCLRNLRRFCNEVVACDDVSTDGTREFLAASIKPENLILVPTGEQDFRQELRWKQRMLDGPVARLKPWFVYWADADEELDDAGVRAIRGFCEEEARKPSLLPGWRLHYTQLWRSRHWARVDEGFDDGWYVKLWRWQEGLEFDIQDKTHHYQFPRQVYERLMYLEGEQGKGVSRLPWEVIHWGNCGKNLQWKCHQYAAPAGGGQPLGGVERHLSFESAQYRPMRKLSKKDEYFSKPRPFSPEHKDLIRAMKNLRELPGWFAVIVPTYNRADYLPEALDSLLAQTYHRWLCFVLDDGSTDDTARLMRRYQRSDPRFFYCQYPVHQGAVWINERGMDLACEAAEFWTRLGSDDWFGPRKLERDVQALKYGDACYGNYRVLRKGPSGWVLAETCNRDVGDAQELLLSGRFCASWANIAMRTSVLKKVKQRHGRYCDPRLADCEDFLFNARAARLAKFQWRGPVDEHDAIWRVNPRGASSNEAQTASEEVLTRSIIEEENLRWPT